MLIDRWWPFLALTLVLAAAMGCGGGKNYTPPPPSDPAAARAALEKALNLWRNRVAPEELQGTDPPITFADFDCRDGRRLIEFQLLPGEQLMGTSMHWPVRIKIVQADGREQSLDVTYIVSTNPIIHISRQD